MFTTKNKNSYSVRLKMIAELLPRDATQSAVLVSDSDWGCFRGCAIHQQQFRGAILNVS